LQRRVQKCGGVFSFDVKSWPMRQRIVVYTFIWVFVVFLAEFFSAEKKKNPPTKTGKFAGEKVKI
jgi:hypothetical protein